MENWGLVTYRESSLLFNPVTGTTSSKAGIASTIAHEFAVSIFDYETSTSSIRLSASFSFTCER